jgi:hypothetical protein
VDQNKVKIGPVTKVNRKEIVMSRPHTFLKPVREIFNWSVGHPLAQVGVMFITWASFPDALKKPFTTMVHGDREGLLRITKF